MIQLANVITKVLNLKEGRRASLTVKEDPTSDSGDEMGHRPSNKGSRYTWKWQGNVSPPGPPEGKLGCQHLEFSPVRCVSDF